MRLSLLLALLTSAPLWAAPDIPTPTDRLKSTLSPADFEISRKLAGSLRSVLAAQVESPAARIRVDDITDNNVPFKQSATSLGDDPIVDFTVSGSAKDVASRLRAISGVRILGVAQAPNYGIISAIVPANALLAAARDRAVWGMSPVYAEPLSTRAQGSVANNAEYALYVERVRAFYPGADGSGVRVGVISDSCNQRDGIAGASTGLSESIASGDLPPIDRITVLNDEAGATDEGRGMMELIYDLAPGVNFTFASGALGEATFANNVTNLANGGCKIIVDDIRFYADPIYQPGIIGTAMNNFIESGGICFSSAGNSGKDAYEGQWRDTNFDLLHDFPGGEYAVTIKPGATLSLSLQWTEPIGDVKGNYAIELADATTGAPIVTSFPFDNIVTQRPWDYLELKNIANSDMNARLRIRFVSGLQTGVTFKVFEGKGDGDWSVAWGAGRSGTVGGHAGMEQNFAVAAAPYGTPNDPEGFSSYGPVVHYFDAGGNAYATPTTYTKPDFMSVDGCNTSFFGSPDTDGDDFPNFFGTSAAAPNAAGVAALIVDELRPGHETSQFDIGSWFNSTAVQRAFGAEAIQTGSGAIHALGAMLAAKGIPSGAVSLYPRTNGSLSGNFLYGFDTSTVRFRFAYSDPGTVNVEEESSVGDNDLSNFSMVYADLTGDVVLCDYTPESPTPFTTEENRTYTYRGNLDSPLLGSGAVTVSLAGPAQQSTALSFGAGTSVIGNGTITNRTDAKYFTVNTPNLWGKITATGRFNGSAGVMHAYLATSIDLANTTLTDSIPGSVTIDVRPQNQYSFRIGSRDYATGGTCQLTLNFAADPFQETPPYLFSLPSSVRIVRPNPFTGIAAITSTTAVGSSFDTLWVPHRDTPPARSQATSGDQTICAYYRDNHYRGTAAGPSSDLTLSTLWGSGVPVYHRLYAKTDGGGTAGVTATTTYTDTLNMPDITDEAEAYGHSFTMDRIGEITTVGENDYYLFHSPDITTGVMTISVTPAGNFDPGFTFYDGSGNVIAEVNAGGNGATETLLNTPALEDGVYMIRVGGGQEIVSPTNATQKGTYALNITCPTTRQPTLIPNVDVYDRICQPRPLGYSDEFPISFQRDDTYDILYIPGDQYLHLEFGPITEPTDTFSVAVYQNNFLKAFAPTGTDVFFEETLTPGVPALIRFFGLSDGDGKGIDAYFYNEQNMPITDLRPTGTVQSNRLTYTASASVSPLGDNDDFAMITPATGSGRVDVALTSAGTFDGAFVIYNQDGEEIHRRDGVGAGQVDNFSFDYGLNRVFYMKVVGSQRENVSANDASQTGSYSFRVEIPVVIPTATPSPTPTPTPTPTPFPLIDTDGDGFSDGAEVRFGSHPGDAADVPRIGDFDGDGVVTMRDALTLAVATNSGTVVYDWLLDLDQDGGIDFDDAEVLYQWTVKKVGIIPKGP